MQREKRKTTKKKKREVIKTKIKKFSENKRLFLLVYTTIQTLLLKREGKCSNAVASSFRVVFDRIGVDAVGFQVTNFIECNNVS